jgi:hypothetical protein
MTVRADPDKAARLRARFSGPLRYCKVCFIPGSEFDRERRIAANIAKLPELLHGGTVREAVA